MKDRLKISTPPWRLKDTVVVDADGIPVAVVLIMHPAVKNHIPNGIAIEMAPNLIRMVREEIIEIMGWIEDGQLPDHIAERMSERMQLMMQMLRPLDQPEDPQ